MENKPANRQRASKFVLINMNFVVLAAITGIVYLASGSPSPAEACAKTCSAEGKKGNLVFKYSQEQTAGMRSRGPAECYCAQ